MEVQTQFYDKNKQQKMKKKKKKAVKKFYRSKYIISM